MNVVRGMTGIMPGPVPTSQGVRRLLQACIAKTRKAAKSAKSPVKAPNVKGARAFFG